MQAEDFRRLALMLEGAEEGSHMGSADFRVDGRIFATLAHQQQGYGNLMLSPEQQAAFVAEQPNIFLPVAGGWGRMGATHVRLWMGSYGCDPRPPGSGNGRPAGGCFAHCMEFTPGKVKQGQEESKTQLALRLLWLAPRVGRPAQSVSFAPSRGRRAYRHSVLPASYGSYLPHVRFCPVPVRILANSAKILCKAWQSFSRSCLPPAIGMQLCWGKRVRASPRQKGSQLFRTGPKRNL